MFAHMCMCNRCHTIVIVDMWVAKQQINCFSCFCVVYFNKSLMWIIIVAASPMQSNKIGPLIRDGWKAANVSISKIIRHLNLTIFWNRLLVHFSKTRIISIPVSHTPHSFVFYLLLLSLWFVLFWFVCTLVFYMFFKSSWANATYSLLLCHYAFWYYLHIESAICMNMCSMHVYSMNQTAIHEIKRKSKPVAALVTWFVEHVPKLYGFFFLYFSPIFFSVSFGFQADTHKRRVVLYAGTEKKENFVSLPNVEYPRSVKCSTRMLFSWALFKCSAFSILFMSFIKDSI